MQIFTCPTCQKEWPENYCPECGRTVDRGAIEQPHASKEAPAEPKLPAPSCIVVHADEAPEISVRQRVCLGACAWAVATIATAIPHPEILAYAWMFPYGLLVYFGWAFQGLGSRTDATLASCNVFTWFFYLALTVFGLFMHKRAAYFVIYAVLCILLALNVVGCHLILAGPWKM